MKRPLEVGDLVRPRIDSRRFSRGLCQVSHVVPGAWVWLRPWPYAEGTVQPGGPFALENVALFKKSSWRWDGE